LDEQTRGAHEAIRTRLAQCAQAGDARKADAYAACFAEDGVLQLDEAIEGRAAIRAWMAGPPVIPQRTDRPAGFVSHHLTTCAITLESESRAKVRTYWLVTSPVGLDHNGYYDDVLRFEDGEWLLEHRRPRTLWFAPDSLVRS
jgi:hypothetical protein